MKTIETKEQAWGLVGWRGMHWAILTKQEYFLGEEHKVAFDGEIFLHRHEEKRDVLGFIHTHPGKTSVSPSQTDIETMNAWSLTLGMPLFCIIYNQNQVGAYLFNRFHPQRYLTLSAFALGKYWFIHY